jgi:hypothetical protein
MDRRRLSMSRRNFVVREVTKNLGWKCKRIEELASLSVGDARVEQDCTNRDYWYQR